MLAEVFFGFCIFAAGWTVGMLMFPLLMRGVIKILQTRRTK